MQISSRKMQLIDIGFGNRLEASKVVVILAQPNSAPIKRLKEEAEQRHKLIDATSGKKTRSVIVVDYDYIVLSSVNAKTISQRLSGGVEEENKIGFS
jgi:regulator of extracellular matrix RemA (YlzA/DUF370 family)